MATYTIIHHWVSVVTPTDRPKSVRNRCVIELSCDVVAFSLSPFDISIGVWAFVIGLSQISSFFFLHVRHFIFTIILELDFHYKICFHILSETNYYIIFNPLCWLPCILSLFNDNYIYMCNEFLEHAQWHIPSTNQKYNNPWRYQSWHFSQMKMFP